MGASGFANWPAARRPFWKESCVSGPTAEPAMQTKKRMRQP